MATHAPAPETKAQTIQRLLNDGEDVEKMLVEAYERGFQVGWETGQSTPQSYRAYD